MKVNREENLLTVSNKKKDLNEVLDKLASKDSKKVAAFLVEYASLPRELRIGALRLVLNDYVKMAKELVLSDEFMYRLNWYQKFSEYQLVNFWNILVSSNSDKFDEQAETVRFKKTFYLLLLLNADAVGFSDKELEAILRMHTAESTDESFKEFMNESDGAFYDYECNFDGMSYEDFKTVLKKCSTVADIRNIASKYGINVPKRLKKEELVALVLEGLRRQGKANADTEAELKKMSAISLQRYAKVNGVKASTEMKKEDIIEYIMNRIDSSPKAVRKPRILLESLPELDEFEFSKDYLREVNIVDEEDDDNQFELPVAVIAEPEQMAEEPAPAVEEVVEPAPVAEAPIEVVAPVVESSVVEEIVEEPVSFEEVEEDTDIVLDEPETPVNTQYNDELLIAITQLLAEKENKSGVNEEQFNKMIEFYEKRLNHLEEIIVNMQSQQNNAPVVATPAPAQITINLTYPNQETQVVHVTPGDEPKVVVEEVEPQIEKTPVVVEATPVVDKSEVAPVVVDSTFDTLTPTETAMVVDDNMDGLSLKKGTVVVATASKSTKTTKEEKRAAKKQRKEEKRHEKELAKEEKRILKEEKKRIKEEKRAAKLQRKADKKLEKELIKYEKELVKKEKNLAKKQAKLEKKNKIEEANAVKAEKERVKEERVLNKERLKAEKELAKDRRKEAKKQAKLTKKQVKQAKKERKLAKKAKREEKLLAKEMAIAEKEMYQYEKKKEKIEKIRIKNDLAAYNAAKGKAFRKFIGFLILLIILVVVAVFTITTLIDFGYITGSFAEYVNALSTQYFPFLAPNVNGNIRSIVTNTVYDVLDWINKLIGYTPAQ